MNHDQVYQLAIGDCPEAIHFCKKFFDACQVIDDLIDRDTNYTGGQVLMMFLNLIVEIPTNRFYQAHINYLTPVINHVIHDWIDSVRMEKSEDEISRNVAYVLRDTYNSLIAHCAYLVGGQERMAYASELVRKVVFDEPIKEYQESLDG